MKAILPLLFSSLLLSCDSEPETEAPKSPEPEKAAETQPPKTDPPSTPPKTIPEKQAEPPIPGSGGTAIPRPTPQPRVPSTPLEEQAPSKYKTAKRIPGRPGFVFNPWTNKPVDARGIGGGTLIRDPNDPNPDHRFRIPE